MDMQYKLSTYSWMDLDIPSLVRLNRVEAERKVNSNFYGDGRKVYRNLKEFQQK
jgi:hypothetical protein